MAFNPTYTRCLGFFFGVCVCLKKGENTLLFFFCVFLDLWKGLVLGKEPDASKYGPTDPEFMYFLDRAQLLWNGKPIPGTSAEAIITFCGIFLCCEFFHFWKVFFCIVWHKRKNKKENTFKKCICFVNGASRNNIFFI